MPNIITEIESNNSFASANYGGITYNSNTNVIINGSLTPGDYDYYYFYGQAGSIINARTFSITNTDTVVEIYNSAGNLINSNDQFDSNDSYIRYNIPNTGYYYVLVKGYITNTQGGYNLYLANTSVAAGTFNNDYIYGTDFSDVLVGGSGNDYIYAFLGDDIIDPGTGSDYAYGYSGDDIFIQRSGNSFSTLSATDYYDGGAGADSILLAPYISNANSISIENGSTRGYAGSAYITQTINYTGFTTNNIIIANGIENIDSSGSDYNDSINIGNLSGTNFANPGSQIVSRSGGGNDWINGSLTSTYIIGFGGDGDDVVIGGSASDNLFGEAGSDTLIGGAGNDGLDGGAGNDRINAGEGNDLVVGGTGNDELGGGTGNDTILGQDGTDTLFGEDGNDRMNGGADNDILVGGAGNDEIGGGSGDDILVGNEDNDTLFGEDGSDRLSGGNGADILVGNLGNDELGGDDGEDILVGNEGTDTLFGGAGNDQLNSGSEADVLLGNDGNDILGGGTGNDLLSAGADQDSLFGEDGNDTLDGGTGNDILIGGSGADQYNFGGNSGADIISGFNAAEGDRLALFGQSYFVSQDVYGNALLFLSGGGSVALSNIAPWQVNGNLFA